MSNVWHEWGSCEHDSEVSSSVTGKYEYNVDRIAAEVVLRGSVSTVSTVQLRIVSSRSARSCTVPVISPVAAG
jgi:hypothetical protein